MCLHEVGQRTFGCSRALLAGPGSAIDMYSASACISCIRRARRHPAWLTNQHQAPQQPAQHSRWLGSSRALSAGHQRMSSWPPCARACLQGSAGARGRAPDGAPGSGASCESLQQARLQEQPLGCLLQEAPSAAAAALAWLQALAARAVRPGVQRLHRHPSQPAARTTAVIGRQR